MFIQSGPEEILLETIDAFVVNSNFCEPPCTITLKPDHRQHINLIPISLDFCLLF